MIEMWSTRLSVVKQVVVVDAMMLEMGQWFSTLPLRSERAYFSSGLVLRLGLGAEVSGRGVGY